MACCRRKWPFLLLLPLAAMLGVRMLGFSPGPVEVVEVQCGEAEPRLLGSGSEFTVLSWNLQFGASREHNFFYDGGDAVTVPPEDVESTVAAIADVIRALNPDLALLQEVDRDSRRTGRRDQLEAYLAAGNWACWASTPYHRHRYVPHPSGDHLGRIDMHLSVLSRLALQNSQRVALASLQESWLRRFFNLKRALLVAEIPLEQGRLRIGNTHLSAFSGGDGTLGRQVAVLEQWLGAPGSHLLGGDLNLLPPGDDPARLPGGSSSYADSANPVEALLPRFSEVAQEALLDPSWRTYLPFGATEPDRKIDYLFYGDLELVEARVVREASALSDHLPILARFRLP